MNKRKIFQLINLAIQIIMFVADFALAFYQDIVIYEITEGIRFNWTILINNKPFWILIFGQVIHLLLWLLSEQRTKKRIQEENRRLARAIEASEIIIVRSIPGLIEQDRLETANEALNILQRLHGMISGNGGL